MTVEDSEMGFFYWYCFVKEFRLLGDAVQIVTECPDVSETLSASTFMADELDARGEELV